MKKLTVLILGLIFMFSVAIIGCRGKDEVNKSAGTDATTPFHNGKTEEKPALQKKVAPEEKKAPEKKDAPASGGYPTGGY